MQTKSCFFALFLAKNLSHEENRRTIFVQLKIGIEKSKLNKNMHKIQGLCVSFGNKIK